MTSSRMRPGVSFQADGLRARYTLPRMDVAVLVGFASRGPLHCPVLVEDAARFGAIFGAAPRLAWDARRQQWNRGHLEAGARGHALRGEPRGQNGGVARAVTGVVGHTGDLRPGAAQLSAGHARGFEQAQVERRTLWLADVEMARGGGEITYLEIQVSPLTDAEGSLLGVNVIFHDVSEARRLRDDLELPGARAQLDHGFARVRKIERPAVDAARVEVGERLLEPRDVVLAH